MQKNNSYESIQEEVDVSEEITLEITDTEIEGSMEESQLTENSNCKNNQTFILVIKMFQVSMFFMVIQTFLDILEGLFRDFCNAVPDIWMELSRLKL